MQSTTEIRQFSLVVGGPFHCVLGRLRLLDTDLLPSGAAAFSLFVLCWIPPALLSWLEGNAFGMPHDISAFAFDLGAHARLAIACPILLLTERLVDQRLGRILTQFTAAGLVPVGVAPSFHAVLRKADALSSAGLAEAILLALAFGASTLGSYLRVTSLGESWLGWSSAAGFSFSFAGWWSLLVSGPMFWFLIARWIWRYCVWARLLRDISRLRLSLVATHPDRCGGLGFLNQFPPLFSGVVAAFSCVAGFSALQGILLAGIAPVLVAQVFCGWFVFVMVVFVGPLTVFAAPLSRLRTRSVLAYGALASRHNSAFHRKWIGGTSDMENALGQADVSSLADIGAVFAFVASMRVVPIGRESVAPLAMAVSLPWLPVLATQIPLIELVKAVAKLIL